MSRKRLVSVGLMMAVNILLCVASAWADSTAHRNRAEQLALQKFQSNHEQVKLLDLPTPHPIVDTLLKEASQKMAHTEDPFFGPEPFNEKKGERE